MPAPDGTVGFASLQTGVWEPDPENERGIHFVSIQGSYDANGVYTGTVTIDGYPVVSEDGQTVSDDWSRSTMTFRDANDEVFQMVQPGDRDDPPIAGVRLSASDVIFPPLHATAATPEG